MNGSPTAQDVLSLFAVTRPLFTTLGDERRQEILAFLLEAGASRSVGDIAVHLGLSQPATSHHLKILRDGGLVTVERSGAQRLYALDAAQYPDLLAPLRDLATVIIECAAPEDREEAGA